MTNDITITFDGPAGVWRVRRSEHVLEIAFEEMTDEYLRWLRNGTPGQLREHAEDFWRRGLAR